MKTIAVANHKGGVGKTTTTLTLGAALAEMGQRVCLIGLDQQKNLNLFAESMSDRVKGLYFVSSTPRGLAKRIERLESKGANFVLIDCPPRLGPEVLNALRVAQMVVVPVQPEAMVLHGLSDMMKVVQAARDVTREGGNPTLRHKLLLTKVDKGDEDACDIERQLRALFGAAVFPGVIFSHRAFNQAALRNQSILQFASKSSGARVYRALAREILNETK